MRALLYCAGGGIGDSLIASIVARALHQRYERVDALTLPAHRSTLERVPDLDAVWVDDGGDEAALAASLREREYNACVVTWATARTARIPKLAKIPIRVGQSRRLYSRDFTRRVLVRSEDGNVTSHWSDILLDYARALQCDTADRIPRFVPTAADEAEASLVIPSVVSEANGVEGPYIILHPTNAIASQRGNWPVRSWAALARALADRYQAAVLLSGAASDEAINAAILRQAQDDRVRAQDDRVRAQDERVNAQDDRVFNVAGRLGIGAFGALARRARAFVGITTGTMHVAAAVGAPTIGIFPFQSDFPERWAPLGPQTALVRPDYPCHPGDTKEKCRDYACIANLDVDRILASADSLIGGGLLRARHDSTVHL
ncbi:MAG TPA: glycosyltransferase family 9 protein [Candidatus Baltobacteraceae bacterium]|nr:glycosyltransferase family 9 protein [Candidatus Baltobacteraceae bacterium]